MNHACHEACVHTHLVDGGVGDLGGVQLLPRHGHGGEARPQLGRLDVSAQAEGGLPLGRRAELLEHRWVRGHRRRHHGSVRPPHLHKAGEREEGGWGVGGGGSGRGRCGGGRGGTATMTAERARPHTRARARGGFTCTRVSLNSTTSAVLPQSAAGCFEIVEGSSSRSMYTTCECMRTWRSQEGSSSRPMHNCTARRAWAWSMGMGMGGSPFTAVRCAVSPLGGTTRAADRHERHASPQAGVHTSG